MATVDIETYADAERLASTLEPGSVEAKVRLATFYPDLEATEELYRTAQAGRPTVEEYAEGLELQGRLTPAVEEAIAKAAQWQTEVRCIVYAAGALTGIDEATKARYGAVAEELSTIPPVHGQEAFRVYVPHLHGTDPVKHPDVTAEEVADIDRLWARVVPGLHINFLHPVAHGNAIEEGWGEDGMVPSFYLNPEGNRVSRLTKGMNNVAGTIEYPVSETGEIDYERVFGGLKWRLEKMHVWLNAFPGRDPREYFYLDHHKLAKAAIQKVERVGFRDVAMGGKASDYLVHVNHPGHPCYDKVGEILSVSEDGVKARFPDGTESVFPDTFVLDFWHAGSSAGLGESSEDFRNAKEAARAILTNSEHVLDPDHAENTLHWLLQLKPDANETLQLAAFMHDIERGLTDRVREDMFGSYDEYKAAHAKGGGVAAEQVALEAGYSAEEAGRIKDIIEAAEFPSDDPGVQLICDADSLSFFDFVIHDYLTKRSPEQVRDKIRFMFDRASWEAQVLIRKVMVGKSDVQSLFDQATR